MSAWFEGPMVGLDTETTGTDPHNDHIVTAAAVRIEPAVSPVTTEWLIHPGVEIPTEASDVHGWTLDRLEEKLDGHQAMRITVEGETHLTREQSLNEIATLAGHTAVLDIPLVVHNASFDLTLVDAELDRHGIDTLASRPNAFRNVVDPMVLEKQFDRYRKHCYKAEGCNPEERHHECGGCRGSRVYQCGGCGMTDRTLSSLCAHYGLVLGSAHDAASDTLAALRLAWKLGTLSREIGQLSLRALYGKQVQWRRDQQLGMKEFFRKVGKPTDDFCPEWPIHITCARLAVAAHG